MTTTRPETEARTPKEHLITIRQLEMSYSVETPRAWASDPFITAFMSALSMTFPAGERFFMDSVRAFRDKIDDPKLLQDVRGFLAQEALHSREHDGLNHWIKGQGVDVDAYYRFVELELGIGRRLFGKKRQLAITCALEHFTAIIAAAFLTQAHTQVLVDERVRPLWIWHAIEELEHKAVAYDVFTAVGGSYWLRASVMVSVTLLFAMTSGLFVLGLMFSSGNLFNFKSWRYGLGRLFGREGFITSIVPPYLEYYRRDFHPWGHDDRPLVAQWSDWLSSLGSTGGVRFAIRTA